MQDRRSAQDLNHPLDERTVRLDRFGAGVLKPVTFPIALGDFGGAPWLLLLGFRHLAGDLSRAGAIAFVPFDLFEALRRTVPCRASQGKRRSGH